MTVRLERLAALGIQLVLLPGLERYYVFARGSCATLVERTESGFGRIGTAGMVTEHGMEMLIWREEKPYFVAKHMERPATNEEVSALRQFSSDLQRALKAC
jgi:hypothetical protein